MVLNLQSFHFLKAFGKIHFCKNMISPLYDLKIEKKSEDKKPAAQDKKQDGKKQDAKKGGDKKAAEKPKPAPKVVEQVDPVKKWEDGLPPTKFDFYDYKTLLVNAPSKAEALKKLWGQDMWDDKALSFWLIQYQKYDKSEGEKLHVCNNMLNGFI